MSSCSKNERNLSLQYRSVAIWYSCSFRDHRLGQLYHYGNSLTIAIQLQRQAIIERLAICARSWDLVLLHLEMDYYSCLIA